VDDVNYYNLLYRISLYSNTGIHHLYNGEDLSNIKGDVEFDYKVDGEGIKSVSLKHLDDVETIERLDFSNAKITNSYFEETFDSDYIRSLEKSMAYCESQTDVDILSNVYNRNYYEATSINPNGGDFSDYAKLEFTQFVNNLMNYDWEGDSMGEIQYFINQSIKTDEDRCNKKGNYYGNEYMEMLGAYTQIVIDKMADNIYDNIQLYENAGILGELQNDMYDKLLICGVWNMVSESMSEEYFAGAEGDFYCNGETTFYINGIEYNEKKRTITTTIVMQDINGNIIYVKKVPNSYDEIYYTEKNVYSIDYDGKSEKQLRYISVALEESDPKGMKRTNVKDSKIEMQTAYEKMEDDKIKAVYNAGIVALSICNTGASFAVKTVVDIADSSSKWIGDSGKTVGNIFSNSILKESKYIMPIVEEGYNLFCTERTYEKSVNNIASETIRKDMGVSVYGKIGNKEFLVTGGAYDPYTLARLSEIQEKGIAGLTGENDNVEELAEKIGYRDDGTDNHERYIDYLKEKNGELTDEYVAELSDTLDLILFGNGDLDILSMPLLGDAIDLIIDYDDTDEYDSYILGY
jgi:hypothetical protein